MMKTMVISNDSDEQDKTKIKLTSWEEEKKHHQREHHQCHQHYQALTSWGRQGAENPMP